MKQYAFSGRFKRDAQGNYKGSALNLPGAQWANQGAIDAYGKHYSQFKKNNPGQAIGVSYDNFAQNYKGGGYASPQGAMGQQSSVPQAPSMMGQQSTFSQQPQNKQNPQMQSYIQQIQQQIQQLQQQLKQMQQSPQMGGMSSHSSGGALRYGGRGRGGVAQSSRTWTGRY